MVRTESGPGLHNTVIGNAAPVQLSSGRILLPHTRNNSDVWLMSSDDDGVGWSTPRMLQNVTLPAWKWVGTGPPGSIQLTGEDAFWGYLFLLLKLSFPLSGYLMDDPVSRTA